MGRRGASHIEVILSFVIFIAAIGFALLLFSPGGGNRIIGSSLDYTFREIQRSTTSEFVIYSIWMNQTRIGEDNKESAEIDVGIDGICEDFFSKGLKPAAFDSSGDAIETNVQPEYATQCRGSGSSRGNDGHLSSLEIIGLTPSDKSWLHEDMENVKLRLNSANPDPIRNTAGNANPEYYKITSTIVGEAITEDKINDIIAQYQEDYDTLKEDFNIPSRVDFDFSFDFGDGDVLSVTGTIPSTLEVYSDTKRVEVLRADGRVMFAELTVRVW